jgi:hypothetical protein
MIQWIAPRLIQDDNNIYVHVCSKYGDAASKTTTSTDTIHVSLALCTIINDLITLFSAMVTLGTIL